MERMQMKMQLSKATEDDGQANEPPPQVVRQVGMATVRTRAGDRAVACERA